MGLSTASAALLTEYLQEVIKGLKLAPQSVDLANVLRVVGMYAPPTLPAAPLRIVCSNMMEGKRSKRGAETLPEILALRGGMDPRWTSNVKAHEDFPFQGDRSKMTPAKASKIRAEGYRACLCRLCALALWPVMTDEEAQACGVGIPDAYAQSAGKWTLAAYGGMRGPTHVHAYHPAFMEAERIATTEPA